MKALRRGAGKGPQDRRGWRGQGGFSLLEMLVAVAILGFIGVAFLSALATSSRSARTLDEQVVAGELAQAQIAQVQKAAFNTSSTCYPDCYPATVTLPPQYSLAIATVELLDPAGTDTSDQSGHRDTLHKVTVTLSRPSGAVFTLSTFKKK